jgi:hypothetical protein
MVKWGVAGPLRDLMVKWDAADPLRDPVVIAFAMVVPVVVAASPMGAMRTVAVVVAGPTISASEIEDYRTS